MNMVRGNSKHRNGQLQLRPAEFAAQQGELFLQATNPDDRKARGQYFTPPKLADFMAALAGIPDQETVRILDPGAGSGVLACALCEVLTESRTIKQIILDLYEVDKRLLPVLTQVTEYLTKSLAEKAVTLQVTIHPVDYILANTNALSLSGLFDTDQPSNLYDVVIANPPYFKLGKNTPQAKAASVIVHGQPNIYALFMAVATMQLRTGGSGVFLTPRSYLGGAYFQAFRKFFFSRMSPKQVHLFESRKKAFEKDGVLQENIVLCAQRIELSDTVDSIASILISSSAGITDLPDRNVRCLPLSIITTNLAQGSVLRVPVTERDEGVLSLVDSWPSSFEKLGLQVSTGPVVAFRAEPYISAEESLDQQTVPLLWMQNIRPMQTTWPLPASRKSQYISALPESQHLLLPVNNYVLLRRFSSKEEPRRLVAAPFLREHFPYKKIGIENHINYISRPSTELSRDEIFGITALLNSQFLDRYFRIVSGNTQVNATELRSMPLPDLDCICEIGRRVFHTPEKLDEILAEVAGLVFVTNGAIYGKA